MNESVINMQTAQITYVVNLTADNAPYVARIHGELFDICPHDRMVILEDPYMKRLVHRQPV